MWFVYILIIVAVLLLNGLLSSKASDIAEDKGYSKKTWFHMCFWLGFFSYIIIVAMPDRVMQQKVDQTNKLLTDIVNSQEHRPKANECENKSDISAFLPQL